MKQGVFIGEARYPSATAMREAWDPDGHDVAAQARFRVGLALRKEHEGI